METQTLLPTSHTTPFISFVNKLATKFKPLQIFNFSRNSFVQNDQGCFKQEQQAHYCNYCLLLVTESPTRIDHEVQDFANSLYTEGTVTIICHCKKSIAEAIAANNRFFITVLSQAELLYSHDGMTNLTPVPAFDPTNAAARLCEHKMRELDNLLTTDKEDGHR